MILLIDTNPILETRLKGDSFPKGVTSFVREKQIAPVGYGAHMARLAQNINESAKLMTFLGGNAGERYEKLMSLSGTDVVVKAIRDETMERLILEEKNRTTIIETPKPRLTREDMVDFYDRFLNEADASDVVVLAKGNRRDESEAMKLPLVRYARKQSKPVIMLAESGDDPEETREARPFGIVVERDVLGELLDKPMNFLGDIVQGLDKLYGGDIPLILVTGSERGSILYARGSYYFAKNEEKGVDFDPHAAAVALAAGIVRKYDATMLLKLAQAAAVTEPDTDFGILKGLMNKIDVQQMEV